MRKLGRTTAAICIALSLLPALAAPASAAREITYRGRTSAQSNNRIHLRVHKLADGRRFLNSVDIDLTLTCEDATTELWSIGLGWVRRGDRIQDDGQFSVEIDFGQEFFDLEGDIDIGQASGTFVYVAARLTDDHMDSQLCTTGDLTWTADRRGSRPARLTAAAMPEDTGSMRVRVEDGIATVIKRVEP